MRIFCKGKLAIDGGVVDGVAGGHADNGGLLGVCGSQGLLTGRKFRSR